MADFSVVGIQTAQKEANEIGNQFEKIAKQIHAEFESIRKKQFDEMNVCNAQIAQLNGEISQAQQAIDANERTRAAAEHKISALETEKHRCQAQVERLKRQLNSLRSQLSSLAPPAKTGNSETDSANRQAYQEQRAALQQQISEILNEISKLENRIAEIESEISRLRQIVSRVNQNNPRLAAIKEECNVTKRKVQTHLSKLKETKSMLYEKHDSFTCFYYKHAKESMGNACERIGKALFNASMTVNCLNRLGGGSDVVDMDDNALLSAIEVLESYENKLRESLRNLMDQKYVLGRKLKDKISDRVKEDMEKIDRVANDIYVSLDNISRTLREAQGYLSTYNFLAG